MDRVLAIFVALLALTIPAAATAAPTAAPGTQGGPAPWVSHPALAARGAGTIAVGEWRRSPNRASCRPLGFAQTRYADRGQRPRAATFSGGWGVAYDLPGRRSAFGIAGAGVRIDRDSIERWPNRLAWDGDDAAGYGLVGDTGPGWLAYVRVRGQSCLYNAWSNLGRAHLEFLLRQIRYLRYRR